MAHFHMNRPVGEYYEVEKEVVRGPYDSYSSEYRVQEYGNPGYPMGPHHHHHNPGYTDKVTEVVYESTPGYYGGPTEIIEKREEIIRENPYDPYRRMY